MADAPLSVEEWPIVLAVYVDDAPYLACGLCGEALLTTTGDTAGTSLFGVAWLVSEIARHRDECKPPY